MSEKNCTMCKWFVGEIWRGECRRFPPYHITTLDNRYPTVSEYTEVCGEFQHKETKKEDHNAALIATAPKMYERLKGVRCFLWTWLQYMQYTDSLYKQIEYQVKRMDEVLKEARSEE